MSWVGAPLPWEAEEAGPRAHRLSASHKGNSPTTRKSYPPLGPHPAKEMKAKPRTGRSYVQDTLMKLVFEIHKELSEVSKDEQNPIKIQAEIWIDISSDTRLVKKHMKKGSTSFVFRVMQGQVTTTEHYIKMAIVYAWKN